MGEPHGEGMDAKGTTLVSWGLVSGEIQAAQPMVDNNKGCSKMDISSEATGEDEVVGGGKHLYLTCQGSLAAGNST